MISRLELKAKSQKPKAQDGQIMLLVILILGAVMIGATAIAGLLMVYQVRQSSDTADSTKAIFAADSGLECELYKHDFAHPTSTARNGIDCTKLSFTDSKTQVKTEVVLNASGTPDYIKSIGRYNNSSRAFMMDFNGATTTLP